MTLIKNIVKMSNNENENTNTNNQNEQMPPPDRGVEALKHHVLTHKVDVALWLTRVFTLMFGFFWFIPIFGYVIFYTYSFLSDG